MKRLNDVELDARIHKFLERKFVEFPNLDAGELPPVRIWEGRRPKNRQYQPHNLIEQWGT